MHIGSCNPFRKALSLFVLVASLLILALATSGFGPVPDKAGTLAASGRSSGDVNQTQIAAPEAQTDQIIIKYKPESKAFLLPAQADQMERLSNAAGVPLEYERAMSDDSHVLRLPGRLPLEQVQAIAAQLMALPEVQYAEPDQILYPDLTPNDPQYTNQWNYFEAWGIDLPAAWDITTGSSSIVVADIDTGITNHADLSGRTVAGYDFIDDPQVANDGDGRDSDPHDPGDWITSAESASGYFQGCAVTNSSWHGTFTAGQIGAIGNNGLGVAGINWNSKILPVRVLGKCGGYDSDIIDGMRWAAGLSVPGVPDNANPAKVLNLSLGGPGACDSTWQNAINAITAAGAVTVVSAGNSNADPANYVPAGCNGVITVAATNRSGSRAYYSNHGAGVEISAPGGSMSSSNDPNGIFSTLNTGTTHPVSDTYGYYQGTSMAAPQVTGVVSLMFSVNPSLTPAKVLEILQSTAKSFDRGGNCNTSICGSGIVDAAAAVTAALPPGPFAKSSPANSVTGQSTSLTLSWGTSSGATSYEYCYDTTNDNACSTWLSAGTTASANLSGLTPATTYYWQVRANNTYSSTYADGSNTAYWSFTTGAGTPPGAFAKAGPSNSATGQSTSPTLSWGASSGATSYEYCYDNTNDNACSTWVSTGTTASANLSGLTPLTTYYWQARANNTYGSTYADGSSTAYWSFTTGAGAPPGVFAKTGPSNGATGQSTSLTLSWGTSSSATSYEYCYDTTNDNVCSAWVSAGTNTSANLSGLSFNTPYYWQVRASNLNGTTYADGSSTAFWSFTTAIDNLLQDPSFEAYTPNPYWTEASTNFGTPLCTIAKCGDGSGSAGPRTGSVWSWFGGTTSSYEAGSLSQSVVFSHGSAYLQFYLWIGLAAPGSGTSDVFTAKIDGVTVFSTNATQISFYSTYTPVIVNVSAFANGAAHTVTFSSVTTGQVVNFNLDDVALTPIPTATFADVPATYWAWDWIDRLYNAHLTTGCSTSPLRYCPDDSVSRAQMAVFLERGLHGAAYTPPAGTGTVFADVPLSNWAVNWIEKFYADGITSGCGTSPLIYCPDAAVTRAQMAVFLMRAEHGALYTPPAATGIFADVPTTYWAAGWIEQLHAEGITAGCGSGNYCPEDPVTRAEMAKFLVLTFTLP